MEAKEKEKLRQKNKGFPAAADGWTITVYTDPLCCWTWAMRPVWNELTAQFGPSAVIFKMAGLIPSWKHFADPVNVITKPIQMGPEWMHARSLTGAEIDDRIWISDPPASSYPGCVAVKAAGLQGTELGRAYFDLCQQSVMSERRNIAKTAVLVGIAGQLARSRADFDAVRFAKDLVGVAAKEAFKADVRDWKFLNINRMPAVIVKNELGKGIVLSGYQTLVTLQDGLRRL